MCCVASVRSDRSNGTTQPVKPALRNYYVRCHSRSSRRIPDYRLPTDCYVHIRCVYTAVSDGATSRTDTVGVLPGRAACGAAYEVRSKRLTLRVDEFDTVNRLSASLGISAIARSTVQRTAGRSGAA